MSFCTQTRDTPYSRATSLLLRPSIVTAVITSRAIDMAHLRAKEGANYVPRHLLTMSCNQSPRGAPSERQFHPSTVHHETSFDSNGDSNGRNHRLLIIDLGSVPDPSRLPHRARHSASHGSTNPW